jgi:hypothetical protein
MGLIAGPDSPAVTFAILGLRVSGSIAIPINVFTSEIASAPASSAARAIRGMLVTFGDNFTITGRVATDLADATISASNDGSCPDGNPPACVFGHETFNS